jgi:hypothetical protein
VTQTIELATDPGQDRPGLAELRVVRGLTWSPHREWDRWTTSVEGHLSTGEVVEVATVAGARDARVDACDAWVHGRVHEITDGGRTTLITGCECLTPATIAEALRRLRLQHLHAAAS